MLIGWICSYIEYNVNQEWWKRRGGFRVKRRTTVRLRRCEHERGPAADGRWRETLVTQQSALTGRLLCTLGTPPLSVCLAVTRQARATPARTAGFMVSVPALRRTHTGHTATVLQLPWTLMLSLCVAFLPLPLLSYSTYWVPPHAKYMYVFVSMQCVWLSASIFWKAGQWGCNEM